MITAYLLVCTTKADKKGFLARKAVQLLPKYEVILILIFIAAKVKPTLFHTFDTSNINFVKSVFLFPYITESVPFCCPLLPVAWTLGVQAFIFILFYLLLKITKNVDYTALLMIAILLGFVVYDYFCGHKVLFAYAYCRFYMLYFVAGFAVALVEKKCVFQEF